MDIENFLYIVLVLGNTHTGIISKVLHDGVDNGLKLEPRDQIVDGGNNLLANMLLDHICRRRKGWCCSLQLSADFIIRRVLNIG